MTFMSVLPAGRLFAALALTCTVLAATPAPVAASEVRFGKNVRVGDHDFSNQRFDSKYRAESIFTTIGRREKDASGAKTAMVAG